MTTKLIPLKALTAGNKSLSVFIQNKSESLTRLQQSIEKDGLLYPLVVVKEGAKYLVIDGKKRLSVIRKMSKSSRYTRSTAKIPCFVQRADNILPIAASKPTLLTDRELAHEIILAAQSQVSHAFIAQRFECKISVVEDCVSLTRLHPELLVHFNNNAISLKQAAAFATIDNMEAQLSLLHQLGPFASNSDIIEAIKAGETVIEISADNIVILPSRGRPFQKGLSAQKVLKFGNERHAYDLNDRIAA